jgi:hypothetical protein
MRYGELITRSLSITWRYKYLWLLAILGGADVYGSSGWPSGNYGSPFGRGTNNGTSPSPSDVARQVSQFISDHLALILTGIVVLVVLWLAWFLLSCITTGALVRASAEHDAERPFRLGLAWRTGLGTFGTILGIRLIELLLGLVALAGFAGLALLGYVAYSQGQDATLGLIIAIGIGLVLLLIPVEIAVGLVFILAVRAAVLEQRGAIPSLGRGLSLFTSRLGRVLLVWLIQVALGLGAGIALAIVLILPLVLVVLVAIAVGVSAGAGVGVAVGLALGLLWTIVLLVLEAAVGAYFSTYWTLAFRRLELPSPRPAVYQYPPQPAQRAG